MITFRESRLYIQLSLILMSTDPTIILLLLSQPGLPRSDCFPEEFDLPGHNLSTVCWWSLGTKGTEKSLGTDVCSPGLGCLAKFELDSLGHLGSERLILGI